MARLLTLLLMADLALLLIALIDCFSAGTSRVLPRAAWVFVILLGSPFGAIAWLVAGRPATPVRRPDGTFRRRLAPVSPDDDPEFLATLDLVVRRRREGDLHD
jgi:hypothetical protein